MLTTVAVGAAQEGHRAKPRLLRPDFVSADARDVETEFQDRFEPQVIPTGFAPTTRAFLEAICDLLSD
jgi:hypothetical protein